jgi:hypothetical protein
MPELVGADFAPVFAEMVRGFGWTEVDPWDAQTVLRPPPRTVPIRAEFATRAKAPRKPRRNTQ